MLLLETPLCLFLLKITNGYFLIAIFFSFFCLFCPIIIRRGSQAISEEKYKISIQKTHQLPISFSQKKVFFGYMQTLSLFWILPAAIFLLPDKTWVLIGPPIWLSSFSIMKLTEHTWIDFGWKKRTYWLFQSCIICLIFIVILCFRWILQY